MKSLTVNFFYSLGFKQWSYIVCPCKLTTTIWRLRDMLSILWGLPWIPGNLGFHDLQLRCVNVGLDPIWPILLNSAKNRQKRIRNNLNLFCPQASTYHLSFTEKPKSAKKNGKKLTCFRIDICLQIKPAHYPTYHLLPDPQYCICPICLLLFSKEVFLAWPTKAWWQMSAPNLEYLVQISLDWHQSCGVRSTGRGQIITYDSWNLWADPIIWGIWAHGTRTCIRRKKIVYGPRTQDQWDCFFKKWE